MKLEKNITYNVIYSYKNWEGNFSGELVEEDSEYYFFKSKEGMVKIVKHIIVMIMAV
jgi:hypothetical protein